VRWQYNCAAPKNAKVTCLYQFGIRIGDIPCGVSILSCGEQVETNAGDHTGVAGFANPGCVVWILLQDGPHAATVRIALLAASHVNFGALPVEAGQNLFGSVEFENPDDSPRRQDSHCPRILLVIREQGYSANVDF
jgi:hypothetical protein